MVWLTLSPPLCVGRDPLAGLKATYALNLGPLAPAAGWLMGVWFWVFLWRLRTERLDRVPFSSFFKGE